MRDFRDAKAMAQTLRQSLTQKSVAISHSESLELVSKMLATTDWKMRDPGLVADIIKSRHCWRRTIRWRGWKGFEAMMAA